MLNEFGGVEFGPSLEPALVSWLGQQDPDTRAAAERLIVSCSITTLDGLLAEAMLLESERDLENAWEFFDPTRRVDGRRHEKQIELMVMGQEKAYRGFFAGNRVGKSIYGAFETFAHLTGLYPRWWDGYRFNRPVSAYACATSRGKQLEVVQPHLIGQVGNFGRGCFVPADTILKVTMQRTTPDTVDKVLIRHVSGGQSELTFKTYEQGRKAFESSLLDWIWDDEEPPREIFEEQKMRLAGNRMRPEGGKMLLTFTPLQGMTDVCRTFLYVDSELGEGLDSRDIGTVVASWEDNPYLPASEVEKMRRNTPERERQAREHGQPVIGSAAIFQLEPSAYVVDDFVGGIPAHWPIGAGMDHGWNHPTAVLWIARDPSSDICYVFGEWRRSEAELPVVKSVLEQRGQKYPIFADPSGQNRRQESGGKSLFDLYAEIGVYLYPADSDLEAGVLELKEALAQGRLKIFRSCTMLIAEMAIYHRKENGRITEEMDDLVDGLRYGYRNRYAFRPVGEDTGIRRRRLGSGMKPGEWKRH